MGKLKEKLKELKAWITGNKYKATVIVVLVLVIGAAMVSAAN